MRNVMALILSGGGGERLGVLSAERAVSALPFGGKYRVIDFVAQQLLPLGHRAGRRAHAARADLAATITSAPAGRGTSTAAQGGVVDPAAVPDAQHARLVSRHRRRDRAELGLDRGAPARARARAVGRPRLPHGLPRAVRGARAARRRGDAGGDAGAGRTESHRFGMVTIDARRPRAHARGEARAHRRRRSRRWASTSSRPTCWREMLRAGPVDLVLDVLRPLVATRASACTRTSSTATGRTSARWRRTTAPTSSCVQPRAAARAARRALADPDARRGAARRCWCGDGARDRGQPGRERLPHRRPRAALDRCSRACASGRAPRSRTR